MPNRAGCSIRSYTSLAAAGTWKGLVQFSCGLLVLACAQVPTASADSIFPDRHVQTRADQTAASAPRDEAAPPTPHRSREEIDADIQSLEAERADLLTKYAVAHPDVRAVDRRLRILREQREMLDRAPPPAK